MRFSFWLWHNVLLDADGGGGGGDTSPNAIAAAAAAAAKAEGATEAYYPEGITDAFKGANDRETIDKLHNHVKGLQAPTPYIPDGLADTFKGANDRETIDKLYADIKARPVPPEKPADYKLELSEDFTKKFGTFNEKDNKVLDVLRDTAFQLKLDQATFNEIVPKFYENLDAAGLIEMSDPAAETEKLVNGLPKELKALPRADKLQRVAKMANDAGAGVQALETSGVLTKTQAVLVSGLLESAEGIGALTAILGAIGERGLQPGGGSGGSQLTEHERGMRAMYPSMFKS